MSKMNIELLKKNIRKLMDDRRITQRQLSEAINVSQPNLSKALNLQDKRIFTVEQLFALADFFNVSVDFLLGREEKIKLDGVREVGAFLAKYIENGDAKTFKHITSEDMYLMNYDDYGSELGLSHKKEDFENIAIYFPSFWYPEDWAKTSEELVDLRSQVAGEGNDTQFFALNKFLKDYLEIFNLYKAGSLSESVYRDVLKDFLSHLKNYY